MAVSGTALAGTLWALSHAGLWRALVVACLIPLELTLAFASMVRPVATEGAPWRHPDLAALKQVLKVRADVRIVEGERKTSGGRCQHRLGRDVVMIDARLFSHHEQLAVVAHEFGHTKQSPMVAPVLRCIESVLFAALWVWLLPSDVMIAGLGLMLGAALWMSLLYASRPWTRRAALVTAWGWWCWSVAESWPELCLAGVAWIVWRLAVTFSQRVSEHLADEAVAAVAEGPAALSAALARLSGSKTSRWRELMSSHPAQHRRGANRR
jgi:hypothetical protein